jgi:CheY-like chemotaxis protein
VIWNLLSNAVKFTPPGGRIEVTMAQSGGAVQITVADTGGGIDPAFLPYVFERFRQADSSTTRMHGGLGLGLAIVRHLVELHGGTVTVESEGLGRGSLFVVTLPTKEGAAAPPHPPRSLAADVPSNALQGVRVIAVDDDSDSRELLLVIMQDAGAEVMAVGSAQAALEALDSFSPHVAVVDIGMPDVDGYELMRRIARRRDAPRAIAFSAYVGSDAVQRSKEAGFAMHMGKPADYKRLVKAVAELAGAVESYR